MTMSKPDFEEIADAIREAKLSVNYYHGEDSEAARYALEQATRNLATACARRYRGGYGFKRQTFVEACGFPEV